MKLARECFQKTLKVFDNFINIHKRHIDLYSMRLVAMALCYHQCLCPIRSQSLIWKEKKVGGVK